MMADRTGKDPVSSGSYICMQHYMTLCDVRHAVNGGPSRLYEFERPETSPDATHDNERDGFGFLSYDAWRVVLAMFQKVKQR